MCAVNKYKTPKERKRNIRNIREITKSTVSVMRGQPHVSCIWFSKLVPYMAAASLLKGSQFVKSYRAVTLFTRYSCA